MFLQLDELEQYGCRPLVRVCGIPKTNRWVTENFTGRVHPHYKKVGGSTIEHPVEDSAGQYFELIIHTLNMNKNPPPPYAPKWTTETREDIKAFIGHCFAMGIMRFKPTKNNYWRQSKWMFTINFGRIVPRDRFTQIWR